MEATKLTHMRRLFYGSATADKVLEQVAFARLQPYPRKLRGFEMAKKRQCIDERSINREIRDNELMQCGAWMSPLDQGECSDYHRAWTRQLAKALGLPEEPTALQSMTYLLFRDVGEHTDGTVHALSEGPYHRELCFYLNLQLVGRGVLNVEGREHVIEQSELYLLNPLTAHSWKSRHTNRCKAVSWEIPGSLVPALIERMHRGEDIQFFDDQAEAAAPAAAASLHQAQELDQAFA